MKTPIFHSYGKWHLSGVNTWTVNLIRAMRGSDFDSKVLFTGILRSPQVELEEAGIPYDFLNVPKPRTRRAEWAALKAYLESDTPCIYITNFDFHRSCAAGTLSPEVRVVTIVHSDEACYYDELERIGQNCDAIVCVSTFLKEEVIRRFPELAERVRLIPYGIPIQQSISPRRSTKGPIRLCYCNRLQQYQKRVFDLPLIAKELEMLGVDYELNIAGAGVDAEELTERFAATELKCTIHFHGQLSNESAIDLCRRSHCFILTSDFEGLPISLLEAMSVGCIPLVYNIESGIDDAIPSEKFGRKIEHGDTHAFAQAIKELSESPNILEEMALNTAKQASEHFSSERMANDYDELFSKLTASDYRRSTGRSNRVNPPKDLRLFNRAMNRIINAFR